MSIIDEALKKALREKEAKIRSEYREIPRQEMHLESQRVDRRNQGTPRRILFILVLVGALIVMPILFRPSERERLPGPKISQPALPRRSASTAAIDDNLPVFGNLSSILQSPLSFNQLTRIALRKAGLYRGPIDGAVDQDLPQAIRTFQRNNGLRVSGLVDPDTWFKLKFYLLAKSNKTKWKIIAGVVQW